MGDLDGYGSVCSISLCQGRQGMIDEERQRSEFSNVPKAVHTGHARSSPSHTAAWRRIPRVLVSS